MVRRGSAVRVRQRASQKRRKSAPFLSRAFAGSPVCVVCGALYGAFRFRTRASKRRKWAHSPELTPRQVGPSRRPLRCVFEGAVESTTDGRYYRETIRVRRRQGRFAALPARCSAEDSASSVVLPGSCVRTSSATERSGSSRTRRFASVWSTALRLEGLTTGWSPCPTRNNL